MHSRSKRRDRNLVCGGPGGHPGRSRRVTVRQVMTALRARRSRPGGFGGQVQVSCWRTWVWREVAGSTSQGLRLASVGLLGCRRRLQVVWSWWRVRVLVRQRRMWASRPGFEP